MSDDVLRGLCAHQWRQGKILPLESHDEIQRITGVSLSSDHACIIISHSCNLTSNDFVLEPHAEILIASKIDKKPDGSIMYGRSRRRIHINISGIENTAYEILARERYIIPRELLARYPYCVDRHLDEENLKILIAWIASRYKRTAFPDEFQKRLYSSQKKLKKLFSKLYLVPDVYIALIPWEELSDDDVYNIKLVFIMKDEDFSDIAKRKIVNEIKEEIEYLLQECVGINLTDEIELTSDLYFTLHDTNVMNRWGDFDYISYQDQDNHYLPEK